MPEFDYCSWSRNIRDKMMGEEQTLRWRLDAPWVCYWEWDIKKVGFEKDSIPSFSKVLHWVFVLGKSLIIKMLLISQKENSSLSMTTAKQILFENLKILFMTSLKLSSTWYCRELPQRRRIQKRSDKTSKPRSNRSCIPSN